MFPPVNADRPGHEAWTPSFFGYVFVSFTNATAISPTDTLLLSVSVKVLFIANATKACQPLAAAVICEPKAGEETACAKTDR